MNNLFEYFRERFPLIITIPYSLATAGLLFGITGSKDQHSIALLVAVSFLFFMLRMRETDEFKDSSHDTKNYPNRPVQRGIISRNQLIAIGVLSLAVELAAALAAGLLSKQPSSVFWYLAIIGYSVLTRFEFFAPKFLERHFNLYFISHQAIFILYPIWVFALLGISPSLQQVLGCISFVFLMASTEIMRKYEIRLDPQGQIVRDTYLAVWGKWAFWILLTLTALASGFLYISKAQPIFAIIALLSTLLLLLLKKNNEQVRAVIAFTFLLESALCYLI